MPGILNTEEADRMAQTEKDFCTGVERKHCGCMRLRECITLTVKLYPHINPDERAFMCEYQKYLNKNDVHELLDRLSQSVTETEEGV